jgi:hypothetical protein
VPVVFVAQYEDALAYQSVENLMLVLSHLQPVSVTDTKSAHRVTSTEEVWKIPTDKMRIIKPEDAVITEADLKILNGLAADIT